MSTNPPIRIVLLDDHPAIRDGVRSCIASRSDVELAGCAGSEEELWPMLDQLRPDAAVLDLHHPGRSGLDLCLDITRQPDAPAVVIYTSLADDQTLLVASVLAGAAAVIGKSRPTGAVLTAVRSAVSEPRPPASIPSPMRRVVAARLDPADHAIFAMRLAGEALAEIGHTLGLHPGRVCQRIAAMLAQLEPIGTA